MPSHQPYWSVGQQHVTTGIVWRAVQAHAQAHTDAQTATRAKAEKLAARAEAHGQAQAQAVEAAHRLKRVASMGAQRLIVAAWLHQHQRLASTGAQQLVVAAWSHQHQHDHQRQQLIDQHQLIIRISMS